MPSSLPRFFVEHQLLADATERDLKKAYSKRLKQLDLQAQPDLFQTLREDYEFAVAWLRQQAHGKSHEIAAPAAQSEAEQYAAAPNAVRADAPALNYGFKQAGYSGSNTMRFAAAAKTPAELAHENFRELKRVVKRLSKTVQSDADDGAGPGYTAKRHQQQIDQLQCFLDDLLTKPDFVNLEALRLFEAQVIAYLAEGWQEGNQCLFVVAGKTFGWTTRSDLQRHFGSGGDVVDRALMDQAVMAEVVEYSRKVYEDLYLRLCSNATTDWHYILEKRSHVGALYEKYRYLTYLICDYKKLDEWYQRLQSEPETQWQVSEQAVAKYEPKARSWFANPLVIVVVCGILARACGATSERGPEPPLRYTAPTSVLR